MIKEVSKRINHEPSQFDVLSDILEGLRFRGSIFFRSKLAAPWGMSMQQGDNPRFHIALQGNFVIGAGNENEQGIEVNDMDIVLLPHGDKHWIADQAGSELIPSEIADNACELGSPLFQEGEITNRLICGTVNFDKYMSHPILNSLPQLMHFADINEDDPLWLTVMIIDAEMRAAHNSQNSIIDRLTEVFFLQLLNKYIIEHSEVTGFFAALHNRRIHQLLQLIHREPEFPWTLELLGDQVGMSRATLTRQFKHHLGIAPMTYISNWRMIKAHHLLKNTSQSVDDIAELVGFSTRRTLTKAFQRYFSYTPSELRHQSSQNI